MTIHRPFVIAFTATVALLVPAGVHMLGAGPAQVAKLVRPGEQKVILDGVEITATADHAIIDAGGVVRLRLVASAERPRHVQVAVLLEEDQGSGGGRVENPPDTIAEEVADLEARPGGGKAKEYAFRLRGYRGENMEGPMEFGHYTLLVVPPATAKALAKLNRRANGQYSSEFFQLYGNLGQEEGGNPAARLEIMTRSKDTHARIVAPATVRVGETFTVTVEVENTLAKPMDKGTVALRTPGLGPDYVGLADEQLVIEGDGAIAHAVAPGKTTRVEFHVTAKQAGLLGLSASARNDYALVGNALDAIEVLPAQPHVAAAK